MKTKFGSIIVNGSGRLGGHSIGTGKKGSYLSNHSTKKKTVSPAQTANRLRVNKINRNWNSLTEQQKKSFDTAVSLWLDSDMFGDVQQLTGKQLHFKFNMFNLLAGQNMIIFPPSHIKIPHKPYGFIRFINSGSLINFSIINNGYSGYKALIYATKKRSKGVTIKKSDCFFVGLGNVNLNAINIANIPLSRTGTILANDNINFYYRLVSPLGVASPLYGGKVTVFL